ncbi:MAG: hypothetical protein OEY23_20095 [Acidimicrobiia bacterium]|nr:hypothetical protein [Acidimicrobiia bacterium]MDH4350445.1 hypothetical protein [Gemmatimonadota bacterium]
MKQPFRRTSFLLAFSAAMGILLATGVVAFAGPTNSTDSRAAVPTRASDVFPGFDRARTAGDALSTDAEAVLTSFSPSAPRPALDPGQIERTESRRVDGPSGQVAYLVPTVKEQVCFVLTASNDSGCSDGSRLATDGVELLLSDADGLGVGEPTVLTGFTVPGVVSIQVSTADGRLSDAAIARGVFYATVTSAPTGLDVKFADGTDRGIVIPSPPKT